MKSSFQNLSVALTMLITLAFAGFGHAQTAPNFPDSAKWDQLRQSTIEIDASGVFAAVHPAAVIALAGQTFTITGFMIPLESAEQTKHFVLSRYPLTCPFCDPADPNQTVEIFTNKKVRM